HAAAAAVAFLTSGEVPIDIVGGERHARGHPFRMAIRPFPWDSPPFRYRSMRESSLGYSLTIVGVTKTSSSVWLTDTPSFLNSQPRKGMRLNHGMPWVVSVRDSSRIPPRTVVSPSF